MKIVPVVGYTVPYPGKAQKRKKRGLRAAALLTATLAAAGSAACKPPEILGDIQVDDEFALCTPEFELPTAGVPMIDDDEEFYTPEPTEEVLLVGDILVPTSTPKPKAKTTPSPKPTDEELFWAGVPPLLEGDLPIDG